MILHESAAMARILHGGPVPPFSIYLSLLAAIGALAAWRRRRAG